MPESQFKLNEVVEFVGIYTFDPETIASNNNEEDVDDDMMIFDFMDDVATHLPPSKVCNYRCSIYPFLLVGSLDNLEGFQAAFLSNLIYKT